MARLHDYADALGVNRFHDRLRNLLDQPLLNLEPPGKHVDDPRNLADPENLVVGDITDVTAAEKRQHVMLAQTEELNVAHDHHIVRLRREDRAVDHILQILPVPAQQILITLGHPVGSGTQTFALRVLAGGDDDLARGLLPHFQTVHKTTLSSVPIMQSHNITLFYIYSNLPI
ncbi:hypothetical protein SDC9_203394 [bioreactor metagenome]|uniref:Uncharacterized protein n=1 Tax=bioreactor metagenome TaxID=1076179 RepID=A0A645IXV7_9ZZZZ